MTFSIETLESKKSMPKLNTLRSLESLIITSKPKSYFVDIVGSNLNNQKDSIKNDSQITIVKALT